MQHYPLARQIWNRLRCEGLLTQIEPFDERMSGYALRTGP